MLTAEAAALPPDALTAITCALKKQILTCDHPWSGCASNLTHLAAGDYP
jgi:hypothetical protein